MNLNFAVPDILDISKALETEQKKLSGNVNLKQYAETKVITLKDETATKENILMALNLLSSSSSQGTNLPENLCSSLSDTICGELRKEITKIKPTKPEDALIIYFAGHGTSREQRFYLLPHNFTDSAANSVQIEGLSDIELNQLLEKVDAEHLLMVIDACQSGTSLGEKTEGRGPMNSKGLAQLAYDKGMLILTATQSQEAAKEAAKIGDKEIRHGLLTYALLQGLINFQGDTDGNKQLSEREWFDYAVGQVPFLQTLTGKRGIDIINAKGKTNNQNNPDAQTPRVFYRREAESNPLILAKP